MFKQVSTVFLLFLLTSVSTLAFDHSHVDFDQVLKNHVKKDEKGHTTFQYQKLQRKPVEFIRYIKNISRVSKSDFEKFSREEQMAFLINAYNAYTIQLIIDNLPTTSIKKIKGLSPSPWKVNFVRLLGRPMNLDEIESDYLRKKYNDPRIHFATNSSTKSSPHLRDEAYVAARLNEQLDSQTKTFLRNPDLNRLSISENKVYLSKLFSWFKSDFEQNGQTIYTFLAQHMTDDEKEKEFLKKQPSLDYLDYDWSLNSAKP